MTETRLWDRAAVPAREGDGRRLPEIAALGERAPDGRGTVRFMRDAELRFETLRLRVEERAQTARGEDLVPWKRSPAPGRRQGHDDPVDRLGRDKAEYEIWISDGESSGPTRAPTVSVPSVPFATARAASTIRTSRARRRSTSRSPRCRWRRCPTHSSTRPASARTCSRPGGAWSRGSAIVAGREAVPSSATTRASPLPDRPISTSRSRSTATRGSILRLVESIGGIGHPPR